MYEVARNLAAFHKISQEAWNHRSTFRACPDMVVRLHFLDQSVTNLTF